MIPYARKRENPHRILRVVSLHFGTHPGVEGSLSDEAAVFDSGRKIRITGKSQRQFHSHAGIHHIRSKILRNTVGVTAEKSAHMNESQVPGCRPLCVFLSGIGEPAKAREAANELSSIAPCIAFSQAASILIKYPMEITASITKGRKIAASTV